MNLVPPCGQLFIRVFIMLVAALGSMALGQEKKVSAPVAKPALTPARPAVAGAAAGRPAPPTGRIGTATAMPHNTNTGPTTSTLHPGIGGPRTGPSATAGGLRRAVPDGKTISRAGNDRMVGSHVVPPTHQVFEARNGAFSRRPDGRIAEVHDVRRGMDIHHNLAGGRRIEVERADHSRLVAERGGGGYVEREYRFHDREFARRSYYYHDRVYEHYYGRYYYRGVYVHYYTPVVYYRPAFYGWVYNPWPAPVVYPWGFVGNPWYGYYGVSYFAPYPVYPNASLWLTDYLISQSLAAAYQAQMEANAVAQSQRLADGAAGLTPDVKDLISAEVQRQIALENSEASAAQTIAQVMPDPASSSIHRSLTDGVAHVFVVGHDLDVSNSGGAECALSQGDALQLAAPPPAESPSASLIVLSSKGGPECRKADTITVQVADLQEMQNHMRETIDAGLSDLQSRQGRGTLPALPQSAAGEPIKATFVSAAPPPESNVSVDINQQLAAADSAEREVVTQGGPSDSFGSPQVAVRNLPMTPAAAVQPAPQVEAGMTIEQVVSELGQPSRIGVVGVKRIYFYKDMKVIFKEGKVSDVQ